MHCSDWSNISNWEPHPQCRLISSDNDILDANGGKILLNTSKKTILTKIDVHFEGIN